MLETWNKQARLHCQNGPLIILPCNWHKIFLLPRNQLRKPWRQSVYDSFVMYCYFFLPRIGNSLLTLVIFLIVNAAAVLLNQNSFVIPNWSSCNFIRTHSLLVSLWYRKTIINCVSILMPRTDTSTHQLSTSVRPRD